MAQVRWYLNNTLLDGWQLVDQTAAAAATTSAGWVVGTGATFSSELQSNTERASTTFVANTVPDGTLDLTLKDALRGQNPQTGTFAAGNWTFQFAVVSTVQAGAADGQIVFRVLKADADGSNATEITSAQQVCSIATNVGATDVNSSATISLPSWTITNQYLFVQVAWKRTGAGGMTTTNIRLRTGSSTTVGTTGLTADFTEVPSRTAALTQTLAGATLQGDPLPIAVRSRVINQLASGSGTTILSEPQAHTAGNTLVAMFSWNAQSYPLVSIVDTAGNTWQQVKWSVGNEGSRYGIYYAPNCLGHPSNVVTITIGTAIGFRGMVVYELENVPAQAMATAFGTASTGTAMSSGTVSTVGSSIITALGFGWGPPLAGGSGYTAVNWVNTGSANLYWLDEYKLVTAPEAATATQTTGTQVWALIAAGFYATPTSGASGTVTGEYVPPRSAALTQTLDGATLTATGTAPPMLQASLAQLVGPATVTATATVVDVVSATLTQTLSGATIVADVDVTAGATLTRTLGAATLLADADVTAGAVLSRTLANVTLQAPATVSTSAALARTVGPVTLQAPATVGTSAVLGRTLASATVTSTGTVLAGLSATVTQTVGPVAVSSTGEVTGVYVPPGNLGTTTVTLASVTPASTTTVDVAGVLAQTLAPATVTAAAVITYAERLATLVRTLQAAALVSTTQTEMGAVLVRTLASASVLSSSEAQLVADLNLALAGVTIEATGLPVEPAAASGDTFMWLT